MIRGIVSLGFVALIAGGWGAAAASADVLVDTSDVTATSDSGVVTATFTLTNTAPTAVDITPTVDPAECRSARCRCTWAPIRRRA